MILYLGVSITETVDCEGTANAISGRSETDPSTGYEFEFVYSTKHTPYLEDMDVSQGYIDTDITLTGEGEQARLKLCDMVVTDFVISFKRHTLLNLICDND